MPPGPAAKLNKVKGSDKTKQQKHRKMVNNSKRSTEIQIATAPIHILSTVPDFYSA